MPVPDKEMLFQVMAQLMEQRDIVIQKPDPLFIEMMDFHSTVKDRVSIPRSVWGVKQFPVELSHLESIPIVTSRSFSYYVIDDSIPEIDPDTWGGNLGNQTCKFNAKSSYLRCAINPCGPCEGCPDYQFGVAGAGGAL